MIHYCTYFDRNYLTRALALHGSLQRHSPPFTLWALCMDDAAATVLDDLGLDGVRSIRLAELEAADPGLLAVKWSRSTIEYYFTCSPCLPRFLMRRQPEIDVITYVDADLFFYSSPQPVFDELGDGSVLIVPHRFPDPLRHLEEYGVFNVGLLSFRNDVRGLAVLDGWREQCLEWCFDRIEDGRFADQRYLDAWPGQPGVIIVQNPGAGLAPWNVRRYRLDLERMPPGVDGHPLVFYHFQGVKEIRPRLWDVALDRYGVKDGMLRTRLYRGYIRELQAGARRVRASGGGAARAVTIRHRADSWWLVVRRLLRGQVVISLG